VEKEEKAFQVRTGRSRSAQVSCFYDISELCGILKTTLPTYIVKSMPLLSVAAGLTVPRWRPLYFG